MSGISFTVELDAGEAQARLRGLLARMERRQPFFADIGQNLADAARARIMAERGPDGSAWKPLRPATIKARERRGQTPIAKLRASGKLAGSINFQAGNDEVRVGSPVEYAAIHQLGGTISKPAGSRWVAGRRFAKRAAAPEGREVAIPAHTITIPARPYLGISAADQVEIFEAAERWLNL